MPNQELFERVFRHFIGGIKKEVAVMSSDSEER